jgi:hypothetical protein
MIGDLSAQVLAIPAETAALVEKALFASRQSEETMVERAVARVKAEIEPLLMMRRESDGIFGTAQTWARRATPWAAVVALIVWAITREVCRTFGAAPVASTLEEVAGGL